MAFVSLGMLELVHSFNIRTEGSIFSKNIFENTYLIGAFFIGAILQISVVCIKPVAEVFGVTNLSKECWLYTALISVLPIFIIELQKKLNELKFGKRVYIKENHCNKI